MASNNKKTDTPPPGQRIKVKALKDGYYHDAYRFAGDVFYLVPVKDAKGKVIPAKDQFSKIWMTLDLAEPLPVVGPVHPQQVTEDEGEAGAEQDVI